MTQKYLFEIEAVVNEFSIKIKDSIAEFKADGKIDAQERAMIKSIKQKIIAIKKELKIVAKALKKELKATSKLELPPKLMDSKMKNEDGSYKEGYKAFAATEEGRVFLERFSSKDNESTLDGFNNCDGGNMSDHYLNIQARPPGEMGINDGVTYVFLVAYKGRKNVYLRQVTEKDVENSELKFHFIIYVNEGEGKEAMAQTVGHEVFAHAKRYADDIGRLLNRAKKDKLKAKEIADEIRKIGNKDKDGDKDHIHLKEGKKHTYEQYIDELKQVHGIDPQKLDKEDKDDKGKY